MAGQMYTLGKYILLAGVFLSAMGLLIMLAGKIPGLGRLPGDIYVKKENFTFYFPLATSIVLSLLLTLILNFFLRK